MQNNILKYEAVSISFAEEKAVNEVSFNLKKGEILGVVGESGSGKSTIIKSIMRILNSDGVIDSGRIIFEEDNLLDKSEKEMQGIRGAKIGMIFQDSASSLCPIRTIGDQIIEAMKAHGKADKARFKEHALTLFEKLNFKDVERIWDSYPFELSGGMNQRVGIAIAMLLNPPLLLADEPTSALDYKATNQVMDELKRLRDIYDTSIILVTHDISVVSMVADNVLVLKQGKIMEYGKVKSVLENPQNDYTKLLLSAVPERGSDGWNLSNLS
ncbi:MAG: ABC transporter ATP-binding protein [Pseudobutyrivibrio sp.]|nr:ABC transporter ATP-binding protein [Pseudobutyrivibrio sp.]